MKTSVANCYKRLYSVICRERARHGSLHAFLRHNDVTRRRHRRCDVICRLLADVARALDFIHSRHLVHGNLTSHAVYVTGPHTVIRDGHTDTDTGGQTHIHTYCQADRA